MGPIFGKNQDVEAKCQSLAIQDVETKQLIL